MPPKQGKKPIQGNEPTNLVEIDSSDDEGGGASRPQVRTGAVNPPSASGSKTLESRSFWKAGDFSIGPRKFTTAVLGQLEHARVHPKFLHSNATSHKWAFGAIAELLDNAVDEICNGATFVNVDRIYNVKDNSPALLFQDDGGGMDTEGIRKCMSLGYSSKKTNTTIGQYGNGFKTSTMRLGADVIVFSRASNKGRVTQSVGLLSYTFLRRTGQDDVIVPMVDFDISNHWAEPIIYGSQDNWSTNLETILEWSPFRSKDELMLQFEDIGAHGTKVIVFNLWLNDEGIFELNFDGDEEDIMLRDETNRGNSKPSKKALDLQSHISNRIRYSLRAYVSMLYLRKFTNFRIILRGKPVEQFNIGDELKFPKVVIYRPQLAATSKEVSVETTIGFIKEAPELGVNGFNVYHKNRLIRPFWRVASDGSSLGNGVVGVLEANFMEPAHDKQDFERSSLFIRLETRLKQMVAEYWRGHCHLVGHRPHNPNPTKIHFQSPAGHTANAKKQLPDDDHVNGLPGNVLNKTPRYHPIAGLPDELGQGLTGTQPGDHCRTSLLDGMPAAQLIDLSDEPVQEVGFVDSITSTSMDRMCEENIQLFMRCEEYAQKENELKKTIEALEKQVEETKRKSALLSARLESTKKQKVM